MSEPVPAQRGWVHKPPTPPKPKTFTTDTRSRSPPSSPRSTVPESTEGVNGLQEQKAVPTSRPVPKPRPRPVPMKRTSLAHTHSQNEASTTITSLDGSTSKPAPQPVIVETKIDLEAQNAVVDSQNKTAIKTDASVTDATSTAESLEVDEKSKSEQENRSASPGCHKKHGFTIIKVKPKTGETPVKTESKPGEQMESLSPGNVPTPRARTPPAIVPRRTLQPGKTVVEPADELLPPTRKVSRNRSYERALDEDDIEGTTSSAAKTAGAVPRNREVGLSSDSDEEMWRENDTGTIKAIPKSITVEVIPQIAQEGRETTEIGHERVGKSVSPAQDSAASRKALPARPAPPPPVKKPNQSDLDVEVKTQSIGRGRSQSASSAHHDSDVSVEPRKTKSRSTFYDDDEEGLPVDVSKEKEKSKKDKKSDKDLKKRKSGSGGHFYNFLISKSKSSSEAKSQKETNDSKKTPSKLESDSKPQKRRSSKAAKSSSINRKSIGSIFYYEVSDIAGKDGDNTRRHSSHIYQNFDDVGLEMAVPKDVETEGANLEAPTPPPRLKRDARKEKRDATEGNISTDDDNDGDYNEPIEDHHYVYPDDPCLDSVRGCPVTAPAQAAPALPARSHSCAADFNRHQKPAPPPLRKNSFPISAPDEALESPPPLPPKAGKSGSQEQVTAAAAAKSPSSSSQSSSSSGEEDEDVYIYPKPDFPPPDFPKDADRTSTLTHKDSGISVNGPPMLKVRKSVKCRSKSDGPQVAQDAESEDKDSTLRRPKSWGVEMEGNIYANVGDPDISSREGSTLQRSSSCSSLASPTTEGHYMSMDYTTSHKRISQSLSLPNVTRKKMKRNVSNLSAADSVFSNESSNAGSAFNSDESEEEGAHVDGEQQIYVIKSRKPKAFYIAEEIMTSERSFVGVLRLINVDFRKMVVDYSTLVGHPIIPPNVLNNILRYLPQLQNFNEDLLADLTRRVNHWDNNCCIADIFVKKGPFLKLYTSYIREFESMCSALADAKKKYPEFDAVVRQFEASPKCASLALKHYMLKPVQRIPQYRLLLTDYKKHLPRDSADCSNIDTALAIVSEVADHANQSMKYGDNVQKLLEIQQSLIGQFEVIRPGRCLLKEGILMKLSRKEMQPRKFFLFNDVLLYTTPVGSGSYKLNNALGLTGMRVCLPTKEDFQNEFSIISTQRSFTISASSAEERDEWLMILEESIKENIQKRSSFQVSNQQDPALINIEIEKDIKLGSKAPVWIPDARVSMCMRCTGEFTRTFRRHHCRACGKVVCAYCSDFRAPLRYLMYRSARVCLECFELLAKDVELMEEDSEDGAPEVRDRASSPFTKSNILARFKGIRLGSFGRGSGHTKHRPAVLQEVTANDDHTDMSGYLKVWRNKKWKKMWFVVKDKALFTFKASEDQAATESKVLLGYEVRMYSSTDYPQSPGQTPAWFQGIEPTLVFQISHKGTPPMIFRTESPLSREKWMNAVRNASIP